jgi:hypothetical protein
MSFLEKDQMVYRYFERKSLESKRLERKNRAVEGRSTENVTSETLGNRMFNHDETFSPGFE